MADISISTDDTHIRIVCEYAYKDLVKECLDYQFIPSTKEWIFPKSISKAQTIVDTLGGRGLWIESDAGFRELFQERSRLNAAALTRIADELPSIPGITTEAWLHQKAAFWLVCSIWGKPLPEMTDA